MNRYLSLRLLTSVLAAAALVGLGLLVRRPAVAALAVAVAAAPAIALVGWRWPQVTVETALSAGRVVEGDELLVTVTVGSDVSLPWVDVELEPGVGLRSADGLLRRVVTVPQGTAKVVPFRVQPEAWGVLEVGRVRVIVRDRWGMFCLATIRTVDVALRVYPSEARMRALARPARTSVTLGAHLSRARGEGLEYADVRPWQRGDRWRSVNWRVSARRDGPWVTERHPERSSDAVVLIDDTASLGPAEDSTLRRAVQAAMALAESHLLAQDRVGLLAIGSPLRWLAPRAGTAQLYRIVDTLLDCRTARLHGMTEAGVSLAGLRPSSVIVALTVLADDRVADGLADVRRHGHTVLVLLPDTVTAPGGRAADHPAAGVSDRAGRSSDGVAVALARRLWDTERAARAQRLEAVGVAVLRWDETLPIGVLLERFRPAAGRVGRAR